MKRIAIVGSGPSGFYSMKYLAHKLKTTLPPTASSLMPQENAARAPAAPFRIDMIEKLPVPYGLVRFGVAPDHQDVKSVQNDFNKVMEEEREGVRFFGNVRVGSDVSLSQLSRMYDAVILAYGASQERMLQLPGEESEGRVRGAREFVMWYNAHPEVDEATHRLFSDIVQSSENVAIVGNGNVAIDCARILLSPVERLAATDISHRALEALRKSKVKRISVIGRRASAQAAFTIKEFRELSKMVKTEISLEEVDAGNTPEMIAALPRPKQRIDALIRELAGNKDQERAFAAADKSIAFRFLLSPSGFVREGERLIGLRARRMKMDHATETASPLEGAPEEAIPCEFVLRSVGYKSEMCDAEFLSSFWDARRSVVATSDGGRVGKNVYASGWLKRGPSGIIGTNIPDAKETVEVVVRDLMTTASGGGEVLEKKEDLEAYLKRKGKSFVDWQGVRRIHRFEEEKGKAEGRPRAKLDTVEKMLRVAEELVG